ncbi:MAG: efflux RND transporter periplasmic adaptor subunit [Deltaproteobacteria bacterium]|jgi:HlyD family secretion protein|nr:efflux RND transporter periplasmic adaptor subunit [Deltaproteobacteria bacterium]
MKLKIFIVLVILGASGFWWHQKREAAGPGDGPLVLYGNVDIRELALGFRVAGRLESMLLEEGDRVAAGDVLARLDDRPYRDDLAIKEAQLAEAAAAFNNAEKNRLRLQNLLKNKSVAQSDYDDSLARRDELAAKVETARAMLRLSATNLDDAVLKSPSPGTVITRVLEPGAVAPAGQTVYVVSLDDPVWVRAYVEEPDLGKVGPGRRATVRTDSGDVFSGQVGFVSPRAEFTPKSVETSSLRTSLVYRLRVVVSEPSRSLRQGMPVTVEIGGDGGTPASAAPAANDAAPAGQSPAAGDPAAGEPSTAGEEKGARDAGGGNP